MTEFFAGAPDAPIVVATDLSEASRPAVEWGLKLQSMLGRPLQVLYVALLAEESALYPLFDTSPETLGLQEDIENRAKKALGRFLEPYALQGAEAVVRHAVSPAAGVLDFVDEAGVGLLVLGTHGRRGFKRWLMGSVAEDVVRRAPCPVLCCHPEEVPDREKGTQGSLLAAIDFTAASESVVHSATQLGEALGADVELLHVVPDPLFSLPGYLTEGLSGPMPSAQEVIERAQRELDELCDRLGVDSAVARHVRAGVPRELVVAAADAAGARLVVIASRTSAENAAFLGGVTHAVLRHSPCPVLVVPPPGVRSDP